MGAPREQLPGRRVIMAGHAVYPGFRGLAALDVSEDRVTAFCYGFHGARGQWWHDRVSEGLTDGAGRGWLEDCFEIAELHVLPEHQGHGLGSALLAGITSGRPERTAVLSTRDTESVARHMYRRYGFADLAAGFLFDGAGPGYAIMGAVLPLREPEPRRREPSPSS